MRRIIYMIFGLVVLVIVSACAQSTPDPVTYSIEMAEYSFTPNTFEARVGQQVTFELVNNGALEHEIMFGRDVMMMDNRPISYQHDMFQEAGIEPAVMMMESMQEVEHTEESGHDEGEDHQGFMVLLPKTDDRATLSFTVTEDMVGEWEMGCFLLDGVHYNAGMVGKFVVKP